VGVRGWEGERMGTEKGREEADAHRRGAKVRTALRW
jgi:hypothetical protein